MEDILRAALLSWLASASELSERINSFTEEVPVSASPPFVTIAATASTDWSTKTRNGREVRLALQLQTRGDDTADDGRLVSLVEKRIATFPKGQDGFSVINTRFLRARSARQRRNQRNILLEYSFRILQNSPE